MSSSDRCTPLASQINGPLCFLQAAMRVCLACLQRSSCRMSRLAFSRILSTMGVMLRPRPILLSVEVTIKKHNPTPVSLSSELSNNLRYLSTMANLQTLNDMWHITSPAITPPCPVSGTASCPQSSQTSSAVTSNRSQLLQEFRRAAVICITYHSCLKAHLRLCRELPEWQRRHRNNSSLETPVSTRYLETVVAGDCIKRPKMASRRPASSLRDWG